MRLPPFIENKKNFPKNVVSPWEHGFWKKKSTFPSFTGRQLAFLRRSQDLHPSRLVKQILKVKR